MEPWVREEFSKLINDLVNDFLGLVASNVQLTRGRLDCIAVVGNMVHARTDFGDTYENVRHKSEFGQW